MTDDQKKLLARLVVRLHEVANKPPFLVRDGLKNLIIELESHL